MSVWLSCTRVADLFRYIAVQYTSKAFPALVERLQCHILNLTRDLEGHPPCPGTGLIHSSSLWFFADNAGTSTFVASSSSGP